ncbi:MAG: pseudouridine synthase [Flavobacteriaceae bacterium]|nr:pseudouridine synthase [Flavobacteriaceae bacterium]
MRKKNPNFEKDRSDDRRDNDRPSYQQRENRRDSRDNRKDNPRGNRESSHREDRGKRTGSGSENRRTSGNREGRKPYKRKFERKEGGEKKNFSSREASGEKRKEWSDKPESRGYNKKFGGSEGVESEKKFGDKRPNRTDRNSDFPRKKYDSDRDFRKNREGGPRTSDRKYAPKPERKRGESSFGNRNKPDFTKFRKRRTERLTEEFDDGLIRLNKYIANSGICSRRQADEYIKTGLVEVNGVVITEMGHKVKAEDDVRFDGEKIVPEKKTYVLLNKPKGFITTTSDERDRKTVMELVANASKARLFPVGRLDRQTTGVLLFTNDGHLAKKLTHPSHNIKKIYHVVLDKKLHGDDMDKIRQGIRMEEGVARVDKISFIEGKNHNEVGVELHIGWNRVVRRIFEKLGYKIESLDRVQFAGLTKKNLKRGDWRILEGKEIDFLKML